MPPDERRERALLFPQRLIPARIADHGFDLAAVAHDPLIAQQANDVACAESRDSLGLEAGERFAESFALPQDRDPTEPGLESLERELLEEAHIAGDGYAPLGIVIPHIERIRPTPPAADRAVGSALQTLREARRHANPRSERNVSTSFGSETSSSQPGRNASRTTIAAPSVVIATASVKSQRATATSGI